jgi:asparagine synthase (glutamine-hydrolysing)
VLEELAIGCRPALDLLDDHVRRRADHGRALWTLLVLHEWLLWKRARSQGTESAIRRP